MKKVLSLLAVVISIASCEKSSTTSGAYPTIPIIREVKDFDGNVYDVIQYTQIYWMKQNLKTSHYRNGDPIPQIKSSTEWSTLTTGAWCWYNNDSAKYAATYGKLYNWYAVNDPRGLAPADWFIPKDEGKQQSDDFTLLSVTTGSDGLSGGVLKDTGTLHWTVPNTGATNQIGFTGLPGGFRGSNGGFGSIGEYGLFWSATEANTASAFYRTMYYKSTTFTKASFDKRHGFSVRCVRN